MLDKWRARYVYYARGPIDFRLLAVLGRLIVEVGENAHADR
jgi:hypothetical protein